MVDVDEGGTAPLDTVFCDVKRAFYVNQTFWKRRRPEGGEQARLCQELGGGRGCPPRGHKRGHRGGHGGDSCQELLSVSVAALCALVCAHRAAASMAEARDPF